MFMPLIVIAAQQILSTFAAPAHFFTSDSMEASPTLNLSLSLPNPLPQIECYIYDKEMYNIKIIPQNSWNLFTMNTVLLDTEMFLDNFITTFGDGFVNNDPWHLDNGHGGFMVALAQPDAIYPLQWTSLRATVRGLRQCLYDKNIYYSADFNIFDQHTWRGRGGLIPGKFMGNFANRTNAASLHTVDIQR